MNSSHLKTDGEGGREGGREESKRERIERENREKALYICLPAAFFLVGGGVRLVGVVRLVIWRQKSSFNLSCST